MYKVLLVDDEELVLKSLWAGIEWAKEGYEVVGTAASGAEALEKIESLNPDLVFTDIRMPDFNGLELLAKMRKQYPKISVIVVSGYAEFAYAQKAIKYGAIGYCLKPFDYDEITGYLRELSSHLTVRNKEPQQANLENMLAAFAASGEAGVELEKICISYGIEFTKMLWVLYVKDLHLDSEPAHIVKIQSGARNFFYLISTNNKQEINRNWTECLKRIVPPATAGVSGPVLGPQEIYPAMKRAKRQAHHRFCCPHSEVYVSFASNERPNLNAVREYGQALVEQNIQRTLDMLEILAEQFRSEKLMIDQALLIANMTESFLLMEEGTSSPPLYIDCESLMLEYADVFDMINSFKRQLTVVELSDDPKEVIPPLTSSDHFSRIIEYIHQHYKKELTAAMMAKQYHLNPSYFSQLFKKNTNTTFTDYITRLRIEEACRLLSSSEDKIGDIVEQVGFNDYFYFSRLFKRIKGMSPTEYRQQNFIQN